jgi:hypothetical protein
MPVYTLNLVSPVCVTAQATTSLRSRLPSPTTALLRRRCTEDQIACCAHVGNCVIVIGFSHTIHQYTSQQPCFVFANKPLTMFFEDKSSIPIELRCGVCTQPWWAKTAVVCPKCEEIFCRACIEDHLAMTTMCPKCHRQVNPTSVAYLKLKNK